ncbi:hypothetical protein [Sphingomonas sp. UYP23]
MRNLSRQFRETTIHSHIEDNDMASSSQPAAWPTSSPCAETVQAAATFTPIEWLVIAIAQRDGLSTLREPSRLALALGSLFGSQSNAALADPCLEILRQSAVLANHNLELRAIDWDRFIEAGFSTAHHALLLASLDRAAVEVSVQRRPARVARRIPELQSLRATPARV